MTININSVPTAIPTVSGDDLVAQINAARDAAAASAALAAAASATAGADIPQADMVTEIAAGFVPVNNVIYTLGGRRDIGKTGATAPLGLPGMLPLSPVAPFHFGAVGNGAADDRPTFAAMDADDGRSGSAVAGNGGAMGRRRVADRGGADDGCCGHRRGDDRGRDTDRGRGCARRSGANHRLKGAI